MTLQELVMKITQNPNSRISIFNIPNNGDYVIGIQIFYEDKVVGSISCKGNLVSDEELDNLIYTIFEKNFKNGEFKVYDEYLSSFRKEDKGRVLPNVRR